MQPQGHTGSNRARNCPWIWWAPRSEFRARAHKRWENVVRRMNRHLFSCLNGRKGVSGFQILMALFKFLQRKSICSESQISSWYKYLCSCSRHHAGSRHLLTGRQGKWSRAAGSFPLRSEKHTGNAQLLTLGNLSPSQRERPQKTVLGIQAV